MAYVDRQDGQITSAFVAQQYDGQEVVADDDPALVAFQQRKETRQQAQAARTAEVSSDPGYDEIVSMLKTATPGQWETYLTNNMTTLAQARQVIYKMGLALMALARQL